MMRKIRLKVDSEIEEKDWVEKETSHHQADEKNQYPSTFKLLVRKND